MQLVKSQQPKHKPKTQVKTQIPSQIASHHPKRSKQRTGQDPKKKQPQKICQGHSGKTPLCRNKLNELVAIQKRETCELRRARKTTKSRDYYTLLPNPASESPLTSTCSRAQVLRKSKYQRHKHEQEEYDIGGQVFCALPLRGAAQWRRQCGHTGLGPRDSWLGSALVPAYFSVQRLHGFRQVVTHVQLQQKDEL